MKKLVAICALMALSLCSYSQFHHSIEIGGSNYTGVSFTTDYHFQLNPHSPIYIAPKLGVGHIVWWDNAITIQAGLGFGYKFSEKTWLELNSNISYMVHSPFWKKNEDNGYYYPPMSSEAGNMLWYNGFDYKVKMGKLRYTFGAGVLMHLSRSYQNGSLMNSGDVIPMIKLGVGF